MTIEEAISLLREISYKPDVEFKWKIKDELLELAIVYHGECAYRKGGAAFSATMFEKVELLAGMDERGFVQYVYDKLNWWELHELDEWFEFRGVKLFDPHANDDNYPHHDDYKHADTRGLRAKLKKQMR